MTSYLDQLNCDLFRIIFEFDAKSFKKTKFKKFVRCGNEDHNAFISHYANASDHAHLEILLNGEDSRIEMSVHSGGMEDDAETNDQSVEDSLLHISQFFNRKKFFASLSSVFKYDSDDFFTGLNLNYPVLLSEEVFNGATVTGHAIEFDESQPYDRMFVSSKDGIFFVFVNVDVEINLTAFNPFQAIELMSKPAQAVIKRK